MADGTFLKIFRRKRLLSSATFIPYSVRFVRNDAEKSTPTADGSKKTLKNIFWDAEE
ncbi:MAG: hypothetical protein U5J82_02420 [Desulfobacterales bacterium]|nr:hypothetical protein [Desulfobacterales bacterium]